jgi:hypothetical protein
LTTPAQFRYPSLGDPKPRPNQRVMLIKADNKHEPGLWSDDCKAWCVLHSAERKKPKENAL